MLAGFGGGYTDNGVPVVGCSYSDRINVFAGNDLTEITISFAIFVVIVFVDNIDRVFQTVGVNFTDCHKTGFVGSHEGTHIMQTLATETDGCHNDFIIRSKYLGGDDCGESDRRC